MNPHEQDSRDFEEGWGNFRDREEDECFGEMEYLFGLYEEGGRLWKEQQERSPIDRRDFTNEHPGDSLPPLSPESPLGDHQREHESVRLPSEAKDEKSKLQRDLHYETSEYENHRASAPLQEPSCKEYTLPEYPHEKMSARNAPKRRLARPQERLISQVFA